MIELDSRRCVKCGSCADVCPVGVLGYSAGNVPVVLEDMKEWCISCGHCEAICPENAITVTGQGLAAAPALKAAQVVTRNMLRNYFISRRSIRKYKQEPVARAAGLPRIIVHGTILWALAGVALADLKLDGDTDRIARFNGRFVSPVIPGAVMRTVVEGNGPALAWRLEDVSYGRVCVAGEAEIR